MKKGDNKSCTVLFDSVNSKTATQSRSFGRIKDCKTNEKKLGQSISRVKFKETVGDSVKRNKSVQFVRNTENPIKDICSVNSIPSNSKSGCEGNVLENVNRDSGLAECLRLDSPKLCSSLRVADKLIEEAARESKCLAAKASSESCSSKQVTTKVLRKVNIPFEEQVYKDLIDLRVNDVDLFQCQDKRIKGKHFERIKDKEPELSDFYKPAFNQEFIIKIEKCKSEPDKIIHFDGFSISDRMKHWEAS